jgi:hypothetical protein
MDDISLLWQYGCLEHARRLLSIYDEAEISHIFKYRTLCDLFQITVCFRQTLPDALGYRERVIEMGIALKHPQSEDIVEKRKYLADLTTHPFYLIGEDKDATQMM